MTYPTSGPTSGRAVLLTIGATLAAFMQGCGGSADGPSGSGQAGSGQTESGKAQSIRIDGSSTVFPISMAVAEDFGTVQPKVKVAVSYSGTGGGMKKLANGEIDICDASRRMKETEREKCVAAGIEVIELTVAFDGLSVVANPENDWCDSITVDELKTIWRPESTGEVMKWSDVNADWPDDPLSLYGPGTDSGTFDYFTDAINGDERS